MIVLKNVRMSYNSLAVPTEEDPRGLKWVIELKRRATLPLQVVFICGYNPQKLLPPPTTTGRFLDPRVIGALNQALFASCIQTETLFAGIDIDNEMIDFERQSNLPLFLAQGLADVYVVIEAQRDSVSLYTPLSRRPDRSGMFGELPQVTERLVVKKPAKDYLKHDPLKNNRRKSRYHLNRQGKRK